MAQTYYPQSSWRPATMTVGQLIDLLGNFDRDAHVVFRSPEFGAFGPNTRYSIDQAAPVDLARREIHYPASTDVDDETGNEVEIEAWTQVFEAWSGVEIG